jgi:hypothetical protein
MAPILQRIAGHMSLRRTKADVDALDIDADLLPHFYILQIERGSSGASPRLRVRLSGTALDRAFGRGVGGKYMEEFLHGPRSADVLNGFHSCAKTHNPLWMRQVVEFANRPPRYVEGVAFYVEPELIYGGLVFGEISRDSGGESFESRRI